MKKIILLLCVMVGSVCLTGAIQSDGKTSSTSDCTISVVDEDGEGINRVLVEVQNSSFEGFTDVNGYITISCDENATFILSRSGYNTVQVPRNNSSALKIVMTSGNNE